MVELFLYYFLSIYSMENTCIVSSGLTAENYCAPSGQWTLLSSNNLYLWREINIPNRDCVICSDFLNKKQSVISPHPHSQSSKVISLFGASGSEEETLGENFSMVPLQYYALSPWYYWIICIFNKCIPDKTCWKRNFLKRFQVFRQNFYFWWKSLGPA